MVVTGRSWLEPRLDGTPGDVPLGSGQSLLFRGHLGSILYLNIGGSSVVLGTETWQE